MIKILGIDPGSINTGYGIIESKANHNKHIESGVIQVKGETLAEKLKTINAEIITIIKTFEPDEIAIEKVFMHRNADSALKLGQARAAAISGTFKKGLDVFEYSAREVKLAVVGTGSAEKEQVREMVKLILGIKNKDLNLDESDALAIAICHAHSHPMKSIVKELQK